MKKVIIAIVVIVVILGIFGMANSKNDEPQMNTNVVENNEQQTVEPPVENTVPLGMRNAVGKAKDYLAFQAFSYSGLIEQLEFEGFTHEEAVYGADNCGANWNEQAVKKGADYLNMMSFSKQGLIEQLEFEGFTHEQAVYSAEQNGF